MLPTSEETKALLGYNPDLSAQELEDAERQAMDTSKTIYDLKTEIAVLLKKEKMTELETKQLEEKNKQLSDQLTIFDAKTDKIRFLIDQASRFQDLISPRPRENFNEDMLPKVIVCGIAENNIPRIIVCDDKRRSRNYASTSSFPVPQTRVLPQLAKKLSESYAIQKRLAEEDADLKNKKLN
ncbi:uncharacterized protein LOC116160168 [Photinus pyralis]|uniref:uncharacterized protein LOC116160168 n=1 Tax=Photinus pyralis TaxID=7054 RepID=UPI001267026D|nr:uncharacterized protein LOC116160168 [Photinus pyralis]